MQASEEQEREFCKIFNTAAFYQLHCSAIALDKQISGITNHFLIKTAKHAWIVWNDSAVEHQSFDSQGNFFANVVGGVSNTKGKGSLTT